MGERISIAVKQMEHYHQGKDKIGLDLGGQWKRMELESRASQATYQGAHPAQGPGGDHGSYNR
jgi:hypothetical protein